VYLCFASHAQIQAWIAARVVDRQRIRDVINPP